jgi:hypothetical protein
MLHNVSMHFAYEKCLRAWQWLIAENGVRATVLLVLITAWYAWLTYRMAKSMNRQTRAQIQPILKIDINVGQEEFLPKGTFSVKNIGTQPSLIRHMRMTCRRDSTEEYTEYLMYERHLLPPQDWLSFHFDFAESFTKRGFIWWSPGVCSFNLCVVASDLSGDVTLTYDKNEYWKTLGVSQGMPWWVRRKFIAAYFRQRYYRVLYKIKPPKPILMEPEAQQPEIQSEPLQEGEPAPPAMEANRHPVEARNTRLEASRKRNSVKVKAKKK